MTVSLLSRFQGCLSMTLWTLHGDRPQAGVTNGPTVTDWLKRWSTSFQAYPDVSTSPDAPLKEDYIWHSIPEFWGCLTVLALWHHEYIDGFRADLRRSAGNFAQQFPDLALSEDDQAWLQIWQRLLTLILSERFHLSQLPRLLRSPFLTDPLGLPEAMAQDCQAGLGAIATALDRGHRLDRHLGQKKDSISQTFAQKPSPQLLENDLAWAICWAIYCWADTPTQPLLSLGQCRRFSLGLPFVAALSGAYHGQGIIRPILTVSATELEQINEFAAQLFRQWSGSLASSPGLLGLTSTGPLATQRRSSLKLISQQDYGQFS